LSIKFDAREQMMEKPNVLFLCTGNSARSQIAEALLRHLAGDRFNVHSAGTHPRPIHPLAIEAMLDLGIDISGQRSKDLAEYLGRLPVRHLIIVCGHAAKTCPVAWPGVLTRQIWDLEDPAACEGAEEEKLLKFIETRDDLDTRLRAWLDSL
jgi:arsenate reductase